ncbi:MAG: hypothetical protein KAR47_09090 [Planctomycetes bacterium]|nr:hypothetical protein [Planctomycetota bacterium]
MKENIRSICCGFLLIVFCSVLSSVATAETLSNARIMAEFDDEGLVALTDKQLRRTLRFGGDHFSFIIDNSLVDSSLLTVKEHTAESGRIRYLFSEGSFTVEVVYELKPGWRFITKQLFVTNKKNDVYTVRHVDVFRGYLANSAKQIYLAGLSEKVRKSKKLGDYAAFVRMDDRWGGMFLVQNPFMQWKFEGGDFSMDYRADMEWKAEYGPFASDRACIGTYDLTGQLHSGAMGHRESWLLEPEWAGSDNWVDGGEVEAFVDCVKAFLLYKPEKSARIHIPWCENDYQIDVATEDGRAQFKRIVDACSALGVEHMLYTVRNEDIATQEDASDNWHWEHLLWLNMGIQIRQGKWDPRTDELPAGTRELKAYAESKNVKLMAYVYPTLAFEQDEDFLTTRAENNPQVVATFGSRAFQDWFIDNLVAFKERTGISGYAFDYWSMKVLGHSPYAQWYGGRRVLEELRKRAPDVVIDGRQQYHGYGPWIWLAGSYPHPTGGDEQPESFEPFPDLHFDRSSATQQRLTSYWFRNVQFCPTELMPGFITHQTARKDASGDVPYSSDFNIRDWDYLGWKFSLISSVATAPFAHCVDMIPARDKVEHELFMADVETQQFMKDWFDWTDRNAGILRNLRSIIGPPRIGRADGTAAMDGDHGFIFLFNPNHRRVEAKFRLDTSLGLTGGERFVIRHLYPEEGKFIGAPGSGVFEYGDECSFMIDGTTAWVLEVEPVSEKLLPLLFNVRGDVKYRAGKLDISNVHGEIGTVADIEVLLAKGQKVKQVSVNGRQIAFEQDGEIVTAKCRFAGRYFAHNQAVTTYDPSFDGKTVRAKFSVPARIFDQLRQRKKAWPIEWTSEDLECTWLAPERLLLYIQIAEPDMKMEVSMKLNGKPAKVKKAYSSRTPGRLQMGKGHNTFTGFYADVSDLKPGRQYDLEVTLPSSLKPGQFQGIFFENVETEFTDKIANDNGGI